jgi:hypothetical protein
VPATAGHVDAKTTPSVIARSVICKLQKALDRILKLASRGSKLTFDSLSPAYVHGIAKPHPARQRVRRFYSYRPVTLRRRASRSCVIIAPVSARNSSICTWPISMLLGEPE